MSHIATIDLHIKDLGCLKKAAAKLGLVFNEGQTKYKWYGVSIGAIPEGWSKSELGTCDHAISVQGNSKAYEVGIAKRRDGKPGYQLMWDNWQGGYGLEEVIGAEGGLLKQRYAIEVAKKQALRDGFTVKEKVTADGSIVLQATR